MELCLSLLFFFFLSDANTMLGITPWYSDVVRFVIGEHRTDSNWSLTLVERNVDLYFSSGFLILLSTVSLETSFSIPFQ